jgi:hypothetical protein
MVFRRRIPLLILILGLAFTIFGGWNLVDYYFMSAPSRFKAPFQTRIVWSNATGPQPAIQRPTEIGVISENKLYFGFHFLLQGNGTFTTVVAVPFKVVRAESWNQSGAGTWYMKSIGEAGTIVYSINNVRSDAFTTAFVENSIVLTLNQSLVYNDRGVKTVTLSLGDYIPTGLRDGLSRERLDYGIMGGANYTISFVVPEEARDLESFPSFNEIIPHPVDHRIQVIWNVVGFKTVTLSYSIQDEVQSYLGKLAWGSFFLALGIPTLLTPILTWGEKPGVDELVRKTFRETMHEFEKIFTANRSKSTSARGGSSERKPSRKRRPRKG